MKPAFIETWIDRYSTSYAENPLVEVPWFTGAPGIKVVESVINGTIARNTSIVDMGCGPGVDSVFLAKCGGSVTGIDVSPDARAKARAHAEWAGVAVTFVQASILETGLPSASADVVSDSFTFHNVSDQNRELYATEIHRILRPGGRFLVSAFSDRMSPGSGPRRITSSDIFTTFRADRFECKHFEYYRNIPTEARPDQWHIFAIFQVLTAVLSAELGQ